MPSTAPEQGYQVSPPLDNARPAREVVENLVNEVVGYDVEEVLAIDKVTQRPPNKLEVRLGARVGSVIRIRHSGLSVRFARLLQQESNI